MQLLRKISAPAIVGAVVGMSTILPAQTVTRVRIPASALGAYFANACTASSDFAKGVSTALTIDSLEVRIENDRNTGAAAPSALTIVVGDVSGTIAKDASTTGLVSKRASDFIGKTVTVIRDSSKVLVCAVTVPAVATSADSSRRAFRMAIGASFDFLHGLSGAEAYYDARSFLPEVWQWRALRFGIDAGLGSGRRISSDSSSSGFIHRHVTRPNNALVNFTGTGTAVTESKTESLNLYFAPTMKVVKGLYLAFQTEVVRSNTTATTKTRILNVDSTVTQNAVPFSDKPLVIGDSIVTSLKTPQLETTFGIGPILHIERAGIDLRFKLIVGRQLGTYGDTASSTVRTRSFYAAPFQVTDYEHGFKIGGEVRGSLSFLRPSILVYLAKDFDISRLAGFIIGGDSAK